MIGLILMLAAGATAEPETAKLLRFKRDWEYPKEELKKRISGLARVQLTISPDGKPIRCDLLSSSDSAKLDAEACVISKLGTFSAARDANRKPVYGVLNQGFIFLTDKPVTAPPSVDLSLAVNHMPKNARTSVTRIATLAVDAAGVVKSCDTEPTTMNTELDKAMCTMALHRLSFKPALDENGSPVASIQQFVVEFSAENAPLNRRVEVR